MFREVIDPSKKLLNMPSNFEKSQNKLRKNPAIILSKIW